VAFPAFGASAQGSAKNSMPNAGSSATSNIAVNQGDSVYVLVAYGCKSGATVSVKTSPVGVTDSAGNLYNRAGIKQNGSNSTYPAIEIWYADNVPANSSLKITVAFTGSTFYVFTAVQVSGSYGAGSIDVVSSGATGNSTSSSDPITTAAPYDLVIACDCSVRGTGTVTSGGGFTADSGLGGPSGPLVGSDVYLNVFYDDGAAAGNYNSSLSYVTAEPYAVITVGVRTSTAWSGVSGRPYVTVSPVGIANGGAAVVNNGADFGPDTVNPATGMATQTSGIQEALNSVGVVGGHVQLLAGTFKVSASGGINLPDCNGIVLEGAGSTMTTLESTGGTIIQDATGIDTTGVGVLNKSNTGSVAIRDLTVVATIAQYAIYWYLSGYVPANENDIAILQMFENVEATAAASETLANYAWYIWGYEQTLFLSCGSGFSMPVSAQSGWAIYVNCTGGNTRFIACDFQGQMTLETQESNLYETTVEHGVIVVTGRFYMFGGALYDSGPGWPSSSPIYGGHCPGNGPCLQSVDVVHCVGVLFNTIYQNNYPTESSPYLIVVPNAAPGSNASPYNGTGSPNAQAATFESCIFFLTWPDPSTSAQAYVVGTPSGGVGTCLRVLRSCEIACGGSYPVGSGTNVLFAGKVSVLQNDGYAYVENTAYFYNGGSYPPIVPPPAAATIPSIGSSPATATNPNMQAIEIYLPVTFGLAGTIKVSIGPSTTPSLQIVNDNGPNGETRTVRFRVPAGWSYTITYSGVTLGTPAIVEM
jgi:hypothetical protein